MSNTTYKVCSKCGAHLVRRENVMTTSHPAQYIYDCPECGNVEYDIHKYPCGDDACGLGYSETFDYKKKYEEALKRAKEIKSKILSSHLSTESCKAVSEYIDTIIPELRESEDEKRMRAIAVLEQQRHFWSYEGPADKTPPATKRKDLVEAIDVALSYLEKQKKTPFVSFEPAAGFDLGSAVVYHNDESEDERIRKALICHLNAGGDFKADGVTKEEMLAYLEKQKECVADSSKTSADEKESEDEIIRKEIMSLVKMHVLEKDTCLVRGGSTTRNAALAWLEKQKEQKPLKAGENAYFDPNTDMWFIKKEQKSAEWDEIQSEFKNINEAFEDGKKEVVAHPEKYGLCKPAEWSEKHIADIFEKVGLAKIAREQGNDELTNALQDAMLELSKVESVEWSEKRKKELGDYLFNMFKLINTGAEESRYTNDELGKCVEKCTEDIIDLCPISQQTKQEWSEEDEYMLEQAIKCVNNSGKLEVSTEEIEDWLKSLKNRGNFLKSNTNSPSWKPDGIQLDCLRHMISVSTVNNIDKQFVRDLYEQLQKL